MIVYDCLNLMRKKNLNTNILKIVFLLFFKLIQTNFIYFLLSLT